jgi:cytochrome c-type biogenesis protein CcmH
VRRLALLAAALSLLAAAPAAHACRPHASLARLEGELMCPTCSGETLDQSTAPAAQRVKLFIAQRIRACDTEAEIKRRLVADFGTGILAAPPRQGFDLLAWWLPIAGIAAGAVVVGVAAWRWSRSREPEPPGARAASGPLDPELERRLDEELARFDA